MIATNHIKEYKIIRKRGGGDGDEMMVVKMKMK